MAKQDAPPAVTVVNDDPDAGEIVARVLESVGYLVQRVHDRAGAVTILQSEPPKVAVIDLAASSNHGDTLAILERVRNSSVSAVRAMRVLVIGQHPSGAMFSWHAGADGFLSRPFHAEALISTMDDIINRPDKDRAAHREAAHQTALEAHRTV